MRLVAGAAALVAIVLAVQLAAGGGDFTPRRPADPCAGRAFGPLEPRIEPLAERIVLLAVDRAACDLGLSRERLLLMLASPSGRRALGPQAPAALRRGLHAAIDDLQRRGRLPRVSALLPEVLDVSGLPGIVQTAIEAVPDGVVDDVLPTAAVLRRAVDRLDVAAVLDRLDDPDALQALLRRAIVQAARDEVVAGLPEPLRGLLG
jgi:hypothetical protein